MHAENRADYRPLVAYHGWPDRYRLPGSVWRSAFHWKDVLSHAVKQPSLYVPPVAPVAASGGYAASGGVWGCVALHEESGHNSVAGYFGTIYPPSMYPGGDAVAAEYGDSWLGVPYAAQLTVAQAILAAYGPGAWGVLTQPCFS